jgi:predicted amidohydrolase YtcJ
MLRSVDWRSPPGGKIDRDSDTGKLTGIVRENTQQPFRDAAFPPTQVNKDVAYEWLLLGRLRNAFCYNTVSDAGGFYWEAGPN